VQHVEADILQHLPQARPRVLALESLEVRQVTMRVLERKQGSIGIQRARARARADTIASRFLLISPYLDVRLESRILHGLDVRVESEMISKEHDEGFAIRSQ